MSDCVDEIITTAITQTGGIEDIIKTVVAQTSQEIRRENDLLKKQLREARRKADWLESLLKHEDQEKTRALQAQRTQLLNMGGPEFRRIVEEREAVGMKHMQEIDTLEIYHLGDRNQGRDNPVALNAGQHSSPKVYTTTTRARSTTTNNLGLPPSLQKLEPSSTGRTRSMTMMNPIAKSFIPSHPTTTAGSTKPLIDSMAVAPAPRIIGVRNTDRRVDSLVVCPKCKRYFSGINLWTSGHYQSCMGPGSTTPGPSTGSLLDLRTGSAAQGVPNRPGATTVANVDRQSDLPFRAAYPESTESDQE